MMVEDSNNKYIAKKNHCVTKYKTIQSIFHSARADQHFSLCVRFFFLSSFLLLLFTSPIFIAIQMMQLDIVGAFRTLSSSSSSFLLFVIVWNARFLKSINIHTHTLTVEINLLTQTRCSVSLFGTEKKEESNTKFRICSSKWSKRKGKFHLLFYFECDEKSMWYTKYTSFITIGCVSLSLLLYMYVCVCVGL